LLRTWRTQHWADPRHFRVWHLDSDKMPSLCYAWVERPRDRLSPSSYSVNNWDGANPLIP
jgi:hypothetical protein